MTWTPGGGPGPVVGSAPAVPPAVRSRRGVRGAVFALVTGFGLVVGALVIGFVLLAGGRPDAVAIGLVLALLPVGPVLACYLWLDRYEPEPRRLLVLSFAWGALVATAAALILQIAEQPVAGRNDALSAVVVAPVTEEAAKGVFVLFLVWSRRHVVDGILDGLVYAGLVGLGFAFTENILYFAGAYTGGPDFGRGGIDSATGLFVLRGIFSPFAHPLFTSMVGIGVGVMVSTRARPVRLVAPLVGYAVAVTLHASWNASAYLYQGRFFLLTYLFAMVPGFLAVVGLALWFRYREGVLLTRSLADLAARGYLHRDELGWLVSLPARRAARRNAMMWGGPAAERLVRDYQQQAVELAVLHSRVMRGTAPEDAAARGTLMAQRLSALRVHLPPYARPPAAAYPSVSTSGWR